MKTREEATRPGVSAPLAGGPGYSRANVTSPVVLHNRRGQVAATIQGRTLQKTVCASRHFLRKPLAICFDDVVIQEARLRGVEQIEVTDKETGHLYRCSLAKFLSRRLRVERGHGLQWGLTMAYWQVEDTAQPRLFAVGV
jgi:hypothetical protein